MFINKEPANVNIKKVADTEKAAFGAANESANTGGTHLPGILFRQGNRYCISTAFPVRRVRTQLEVNPAKRKGTVADVHAATNRPIMPEQDSREVRHRFT